MDCTSLQHAVTREQGAAIAGGQPLVARPERRECVRLPKRGLPDERCPFRPFDSSADPLQPDRGAGDGGRGGDPDVGDRGSVRRIRFASELTCDGKTAMANTTASHVLVPHVGVAAFSSPLERTVRAGRQANCAGPSFDGLEKLDQGGPIARGHLCRQAADGGEGGLRAVRNGQQAATVGANPGANRVFGRGFDGVLVAASCFFRRI